MVPCVHSLLVETKTGEKKGFGKKKEKKGRAFKRANPCDLLQRMHYVVLPVYYGHKPWREKDV
jgi:hypothetical protein